MARARSGAETELSRLDKTILQSDFYEKEKQRPIDSLRGKIASSTDPVSKWRDEVELSRHYRLLNADSAIYFASRAESEKPAGVGRKELLLADLTLIQALATGGLFTKAISLMDSVSKVDCDSESKIEIWRTGRITYSYASSFVEGLDDYHAYARKLYKQYDDSLIRALPDSDKYAMFILAEHLVNEGKTDEAMFKLMKVIKGTSPEDNLHGMAAYQVAMVCKKKGDMKGYLEYLAIAGESDVRGVAREGLAITELARVLYTSGDYERAHRYITFALNNANSGNTRMRTVSISTLVPLIEETHRTAVLGSHRSMQIYSITFTLLFILAAILAFLFLRTTRRSCANEKKLSSSKRKLEAYVGNFIELCANYNSRLDSLSKIVTRKINSGQTDELLKMLSSGKINEKGSDTFYSLVDKALLDLFPDFVDNINTLLRPESRITLKDGETLTPELRIYAFIRLGVDDSTKIAQILNYSVRTVYAYRNRMRSRAIDRENFDRNVAKLGDPKNWVDILYHQGE